MFAAAMLYATPSLELSIYSTCKRISQKLMRNVARFLDLIYKDTKEQEMPILRSNMEEVVLQGPEGVHDVRTVNSYPSKVSSSPRNTHPTLPQLSPNSPTTLPKLSNTPLHGHLVRPKVAHVHRFDPGHRHPSLGIVKLLDQVRLRVNMQRIQGRRLPTKVAPKVVRNLPHKAAEGGYRDRRDRVGNVGALALGAPARGGGPVARVGVVAVFAVVARGGHRRSRLHHTRNESGSRASIPQRHRFRSRFFLTGSNKIQQPALI